MIVTFYSYKGGVGRTQLLANLAAYFCFYRDKKVLTIDWDLEAPGLHYYFKQDNLKQNGLLEFLQHYCDVMESRVNVKESAIEAEFKQSLPKYIKKDIGVSESGNGRIDLMTAGLYDETYSQKANHFDWVKFYESLDGGFFIELFKKYLRAQDYDYIFIDSRTGVSDYSGICNIQMPDANVIVIAPTDQNVKGSKRVIQRINEAKYIKEQKQRYPIIIPILSRLDPSNNKQRGNWIKRFREEFRGHIDQLFKLSVNLSYHKEQEEIIDDSIVEKYISKTLLEYQTDISYGEKLLFGKKKKKIEITTIEKQFVSIAKFIEAFKDYPLMNFPVMPYSRREINELFKHSVKIEENAHNNFYYGLFLQEIGDFSLAQKFYNKSLTLSDDDGLVLKIKNNLAKIYEQTNDTTEAEKTYLEILSKNRSPDVLFNLGNLYFKNKKLDLAEEFLYEALRKYRKLFAFDKETHSYDLASTLNNLANIYKSKNEHQKAEKFYNEALDIFRALYKIDSKTYLPYIIGILNNLALLEQNKNDFIKAERHLQESLKKLNEVDSKQYLNNLGLTYQNLADLYYSINDFERAEKYYLDALDVRKQLTKDNEQESLSDLASTMNNLANLKRITNEFEKAKEYHQSAINIFEKLAKDNPSYYLSSWSASLNSLGNLYLYSNKFVKAENMYQRALDIRRSLAEENPTYFLPNLADSLNGLASSQTRQNNFEEAENNFEEAISLRRQLVNSNQKTYQPELADTLNNFGHLLNNKGEFKKADKKFKESLQIFRDLAKGNSKMYRPKLALILDNFATAKYNRNEIEEAENMFTEALSIRRELIEEYPKAYQRELSDTLNNFGVLLRYKEAFDEAEKILEEALAIRIGLVKVNPQSYKYKLADTLNHLGNTYRANKKFTKAEKSYNDALEISHQLANETPDTFIPVLPITQINMGVFYLHFKVDEALSKKYAEEAITYLLPISQNPTIREYLRGAFYVLDKLGVDVEKYWNDKLDTFDNQSEQTS